MLRLLMLAAVAVVGYRVATENRELLAAEFGMWRSPPRKRRGNKPAKKAKASR